MSPAAARRVLHACSAMVLLLLQVGSVGMLRLVLVVGAAIALLLDVLRLARPSFGLFVTKLVPVFRSAETSKLSGATWLCFGYAVAAWFPHPAGAAGILVGAFADPAASLVGSSAAPAGGNKTWAGSGAAALAAALALLSIGISISAVLIGALAAMVLERWPGPFNDNVTVPIGVATVVWLLQ